MGEGGKGELGWIKAFPAQKFIHSANIYGVLSVARPPAGVGDTPVPRGRLVVEVYRDSATMLGERRRGAPSRVGGVGPERCAKLVRYCGVGRACLAEGSACAKARR